MICNRIAKYEPKYRECICSENTFFKKNFLDPFQWTIFSGPFSVSVDPWLINLILSNKPSSFNKTLVSETGLSDYPKMITTFFKSNIFRLRPKVITYRNNKKFDKEKFLNDMKETNVRIFEKNLNQNYPTLTKTFLTFVDKHDSLKVHQCRFENLPTCSCAI